MLGLGFMGVLKSNTSMQIKHFIIFFFTLVFVQNLCAQEQPKHKKKWYIDENGKFFTNRHLPVYIRLSHSPDENAPSHLLRSHSTPEYTNPMYFDAEGYNSFRSPSAVDTVTKQLAQPKRDIKFEVYSDGIAPKTKITFSNAKKYTNREGKKFFGKEMIVSLLSQDDMSGVDGIFYSINGKKYKEYKGEIAMNEEGNFNLKYYAVDNVGNVEEVHQSNFVVDLSPPSTTYHVEGEVINGNIAPNAQIVLSAEDALSGVSKIMYSLNNSTPKLYRKSINLSDLDGGNVKLNFFSVDMVGNSEENTNVDKKTSKSNEYVAYLDKTGPKSSAEIIGDKYQAARLFVSGRSKIKLSAYDGEIQVKKINYSINSRQKNEVYSEAFGLNYSRNGIYTVNFSATDQFGNIGENAKLEVFLDNLPPMSKITIGEPKFVYQNLIMITRNTNIHIDAMDLGSQVKDIEYGIDNSNFTKGSDFKPDIDGKHIINYRATDNVNNLEDVKSLEVIVDNKAPEIHVVHSMQAIGKESKNGQDYPVYPDHSALFLGATDGISGISKLAYSINGNKEINYITNPLISYKLPIVEEGFYSVKVMAVDKLGNKADKIVEFFVRSTK